MSCDGNYINIIIENIILYRGGHHNILSLLKYYYYYNHYFYALSISNKFNNC